MKSLILLLLLLLASCGRLYTAPDAKSTGYALVTKDRVYVTEGDSTREYVRSSVKPKKGGW